MDDGIDAEGYSRGVLPLAELNAFVDANFVGDVDIDAVLQVMCLRSLVVLCHGRVGCRHR